MAEETNRDTDLRKASDATAIAVISTQIASLSTEMNLKLANHLIKLENIEKQTKMTNGHVADNLRRINELDGWKNKIVGGLTISNIIAIPILMWLVYEHLGG